ncbi:hypothetical protein [Caballeronia sp. J97]|uniref:hypothetical protein n=1 Tax=Caballeronia sp. J97 TaxID=2805429 RepID=UPI002AB28F5D|nr:hypothetical protein [Caballeronia sp. J97]
MLDQARDDRRAACFVHPDARRANGATLGKGAYLVGGAVSGEVSVGASGNARRITNLSAGAEDSDAVNVSQLKALDSSIRNNAVMYDGDTKQSVTFAGHGGTQLKNVADATDATDAVNLAQLNALGSGLRDGAVMYDGDASGAPDFGRVTLRGNGGTAIDNVAAGVISSNSLKSARDGIGEQRREGFVRTSEPSSRCAMSDASRRS